jgi:FKBP-type peptidyl-prolyl cis-trans isomerase 2
MNTVTTDSVLQVSYTLSLDDGTTFPPRHSGDVLEIEMGAHDVLPGFERALLGMREGEARRVRIGVTDAYGPSRPEKVFWIDRPGSLKTLAVGDAVRVVGVDEGEFNAVVREVGPSKVLVDANHPLCGQEITLEIRVLGVRTAETSVLRASRSRSCLTV